MSWSSEGLPVVTGQLDAYWSVADAALLYTEYTRRQLRDMFRCASLSPAGKRAVPGRGPRHERVYCAAEVVALLDASGVLVGDSAAAGIQDGNFRPLTWENKNFFKNRTQAAPVR